MILEDQEVAEILHDRNATLNNNELLILDHPISFSCDDEEGEKDEDEDEDADYDYGNGINIPQHNPDS